MSASTLLAAIDAEMLAIIQGRHESYSIQSRSVQRLRLKELHEMRKDLQAEVTAETATGSMFRLAKMTKASK